ncbi:MAG: class I SAM-dependent methyltransferase [Candidatus Acidiferrum sp.]
MPRYNEKEKIRQHYDVVSPYYISLWGNHIHHGYWIRGDESKEQAQLQLIDHLAQAATFPRDSTLLDIGCGFGGSSIYLSKKYNARATGITISPVQVDLANKAAKLAGANAVFLHMDAEAMTFPEPFDVLWSVESISHYQDLGKFFASASRLLKPGGTMAITDWFKKDGLTPEQSRKALGPIEKGMLIEMHTMKEYEDLMEKNGLKIAQTEVLNKECAKTWDLGLDIIKKKEFWAIAAWHGIAFLHFLRSFKSMRAGFASGNFVYGLIVARKI